MSILISAAVDASDLSKNQKPVAKAYADFANDDGEGVYPAMARIAYNTSYEERQVRRITKELVDIGVLVYVGKTQYNTNVYRFVVDALPKRPPYVPARMGRPTKIRQPKQPEMEPELEAVVFQNPLPADPEPSEDAQKVADILAGIYSDNPETEKVADISEKVADILNKSRGHFEQKSRTSMSENPLVNHEVNHQLNTRVEHPSVSERKARTKAALVAGIANHIDGGKDDPGSDDYPEDVRALLVKFCDLWGLRLPAKPARGNESKSDFGLWITQGRDLQRALNAYHGAGGWAHILDQAANDYWQETNRLGRMPYVVARPSAIIRSVTAKIGHLTVMARGNGAKAPADFDPEPFRENLPGLVARLREIYRSDTDRYFKAMDAVSSTLGVEVYLEIDKTRKMVWNQEIRQEAIQ